MKPKLLLTLICVLVLSSAAFAQDFKSKFKDTFGKGKTDSALIILNQWQKVSPDDPELYVYFYNFYAQEGLKPIISLTTDKQSSDAVEIKDKGKKTAAYLGTTNGYNETLIKKGFSYIDAGISKYPNRLDMRFGKVYVLGRIDDYNTYTQEIIKAIDYGQKIDLKWAWTDGKPLDDPERFMLGTIQQYVVQMFNAGNKYANNIKDIAGTVLKYYPDHVESLSDLGISYIIIKDYANALPPLLKAEKINPQDYVVLNNIAFAYSLLGDKTNAIKYYELMAKYGDEDAKKTAAEKIAELNK